MSNATTEGMARLERPTDNGVQHIINNARAVETDSDTVTDHSGDLLEVGSLPLSSLLFQAEVFEVLSDGETSTVMLEREPITFEGDGEGFIHFKIRADAETHTVKSLTVDAQLKS
ncbi:hypothetical protein GRX03_03405 [Halovenus sp. WSH3]|uniref:Uncharacterized protein n=1 Tax=Halovenus carboxidivorans TaxID=2692199 RepID=A0A6B0T3A2_9EURY|nr:hypothetical protein [Halovenus carboxidivorans]MXR50656.1 hypothetical protein [Halovenus carboxidivorans]